MYDIVCVVQRFVNLKVGSVFGFLHPENVVSVSIFGFKNEDIYIFFGKPKTETAVSVFETDTAVIHCSNRL